MCVSESVLIMKRVDIDRLKMFLLQRLKIGDAKKY